MAVGNNPVAEWWMEGPGGSKEGSPETKGLGWWFVDEWPIGFRCSKLVKEDGVVVCCLAESAWVKGASVVINEFGEGGYL